MFNAYSMGYGPGRQQAYEGGIWRGALAGVGAGVAVTAGVLSRMKELPSKRDMSGEVVTKETPGDFIHTYEQTAAAASRREFIRINPVVFIGGKVHCTIVKKIQFLRTTTTSAFTGVVMVPKKHDDYTPFQEKLTERNVLATYVTYTSAEGNMHEVEVNRIVPLEFLVIDTNAACDIRLDLDVARLDPETFWNIVVSDYDIDLDSIFMYHPAIFRTVFAKDLIGWMPPTK